MRCRCRSRRGSAGRGGGRGRNTRTSLWSIDTHSASGVGCPSSRSRPCSRLRTMKMILTPRQREIWELAGRLADTFAERAQTFDRENRFPFENYEELRESGYLRLTVPEELGGLGASLYETVLAQERLAQGDGSTALAV